MIRQAAERTGAPVGDGTTTSTLIAAAIFGEGVKNIAAGAGAIELKRESIAGFAPSWPASRTLFEAGLPPGDVVRAEVGQTSVLQQRDSANGSRWRSNWEVRLRFL